jgi:hypothetical protein
MLVQISTMPDKKQVKMYLDEDLVEQLDRSAKLYHRRSVQQVIEEVVKNYFPIWQKSEEQQRETLAKQSSIIDGDPRPRSPRGVARSGKRG